MYMKKDNSIMSIFKRSDLIACFNCRKPIFGPMTQYGNIIICAKCDRGVRMWLKQGQEIDFYLEN